MKACRQHPSRYQRGHWYSFDGRTNNSRGLSFRNGLEAAPRLAGVVTKIPLPPYFLRGDKQYDNVFLIVGRFVEKTFCSFAPVLYCITFRLLLRYTKSSCQIPKIESSLSFCQLYWEFCKAPVFGVSIRKTLDNCIFLAICTSQYHDMY